MQAVLDAKPIEQITPVKARIEPTAAHGANAVMRRQAMSTAPDPPVTTQDIAYGWDPMQYARIYRPAAAPTGAPMPVVFYYHGGGWVIAKQLNAIVVSAEYRHAPEFKFPAQHDDAAPAYRWVLQNAASRGGDPAKVALAGESVDMHIDLLKAM